MSDEYILLFDMTSLCNLCLMLPGEQDVILLRGGGSEHLQAEGAEQVSQSRQEREKPDQGLLQSSYSLQNRQSAPQ